MTSYGRLDKVQEFLNDPSVPLLLPEKALRLKLQSHDQLNRRTVIHLKAVFTLSQLRRAHVYDCEDFPHLHNPDYIVRKFDDTLNRDVVVLKSVCWLHFRKAFDNVLPGTSSLRVDENAQCAVVVLPRKVPLLLAHEAQLQFPLAQFIQLLHDRQMRPTAAALDGL